MFNTESQIVSQLESKNWEALEMDAVSQLHDDKGVHNEEAYLNQEDPSDEVDLD